MNWRSAIAPTLVVGALAVTVAANGVLIVAASRGGGAVVEPDYYRRAVEWDSTVAARRRSDALGWRAEAQIAAIPEAGRLTVRIVDGAGRPVAGAIVEVTAIHNAAAARPIEAVLATGPDGAASARLPLDRPGLWELRLQARRGTDVFLATLHRERPFDAVQPR